MAVNKVANTLEPWNDLRGKVILVTGASSGLGWELCIDLAKAGCKIVAAARRFDRLKSLCELINQPGLDIIAAAIELDVAGKSSAIQAAVRKAWNAFGHIHVLINNAGISGKSYTVLDLPEEEWDRTSRTNLDGSWLVSKYVCQRMCDAGRGGSVINISSMAGLDRGPVPRNLAYATSKGGINTMTKVMAMELGPKKIRVNSICPAIFDSEITRELMKQKFIMGFVKGAVPMRNFLLSNPHLTSMARYLIHDSSEYVTGNIFIVDGGVTLVGVPIFSSL